VADSSPAVGAVVGGRFTLKSTLGSGGFGSVWLAADRLKNDAPVALKILHAALRKDPRILERFRREAITLGALDHPRIARSLAWNVSEGDAFIAMEFVGGRSLRDVMKDRADRGAHFTIAELTAITRQISAAIAHAHAHDILHRDLKPDNVIIESESPEISLRVLDFGLAKIMSGSASDATTVGRVFGTLLYMAPEQIAGGDVSLSADVFAFGTMLFELATLRLAWARDWEDRPIAAGDVPDALKALNSRVAVMQRIGRGLRPKATPHRADLHAAVDRVLACAMSIDPRERFESITALERAFVAALEGKDDALVPSPRGGDVEATAGPGLGARIPPSDTLVDPSRRPAEAPRDAAIATSPTARAVEPRIDPPPPLREHASDARAEPDLPPTDPSGRALDASGGAASAAVASIDPSRRVADTSPIDSSRRTADALRIRDRVPGAQIEPSRRSPTAPMTPLATTSEPSRSRSARRGRSWRGAITVISVALGAIAVGIGLGSIVREAPSRADPPPGAPASIANELPAAVAHPMPRASDGSEPAEETHPAPRPRPASTAEHKAARAQDRPPRDSPRAAHAPEPYPELRRLLEWLERNPTDYALAQRLSTGIASAADALPDRSIRTSIKRCATASTFPVDPVQFRACLTQLIESTPK
jgi:serine/threonine protein kinase